MVMENLGGGEGEGVKKMHYGLPENGEWLIYTQITNYDCGSGQITDSDIQISTGIYFLARKFQA